MSNVSDIQIIGKLYIDGEDMTVAQIIDELTYRSYREQRRLSPHIAPERWGAIYPHVEQLEGAISERGDSMKRDRSEMGRALASIDQQIDELQRVRQILIDARGPQHVGAMDMPKRGRRTKTEIAAAASDQN